jgi:hypothetical protein
MNGSKGMDRLRLSDDPEGLPARQDQRGMRERLQMSSFTRLDLAHPFRERIQFSIFEGKNSHKAVCLTILLVSNYNCFDLADMFRGRHTLISQINPNRQA